jgi:uncharacterized protein with GYD domain
VAVGAGADFDQGEIAKSIVGRANATPVNTTTLKAIMTTHSNTNWEQSLPTPEVFTVTYNGKDYKHKYLASQARTALGNNRFGTHVLRIVDKFLILGASGSGSSTAFSNASFAADNIENFVISAINNALGETDAQEAIVKMFLEAGGPLAATSVGNYDFDHTAEQLGSVALNFVIAAIPLKVVVNGVERTLTLKNLPIKLVMQ